MHSESSLCVFFCHHLRLVPDRSSNKAMPDKKRAFKTQKKGRDDMFDVLCVESCHGDNGFIFKKGHTYRCMGQKDIIAVIHDDNDHPHLFYKREFESCFQPI